MDRGHVVELSFYLDWAWSQFDVATVRWPYGSINLLHGSFEFDARTSVPAHPNVIRAWGLINGSTLETEAIWTGLGRNPPTESQFATTPTPRIRSVSVCSGWMILSLDWIHDGAVGSPDDYPYTPQYSGSMPVISAESLLSPFWLSRANKCRRTLVSQYISVRWHRWS